MNRYHAHRDSDWPMVTTEDFRALLMLLALFVVVIGMCVVSPS